MNITQLDHVAIHVSDLEASKFHYGEVLQLPVLPRPDFEFPGAWFAIGAHELHLIGNRSADVNSHHRGTHFAVRVEDIDSIQLHMERCGVEFIRKHRPDGAHQIFIRDPDGHYMEFCQPSQSP